MGLAWYVEIAGEWTPPVHEEVLAPGQVRQRCHWHPIVLDRREVHQLFEAPELSAEERLVLRVLYASGMRVEELTALEQSALDLASRTLVLMGGRRVAVDPETFEELSQVNWAGWKWSAERVQAVLERAAASCRVAERYRAVGRTLLPKALRHAYGSHCLENGMDLYSLHNLIGNKYVDTTEILLMLAVGRWRPKYDSCHPLAGQRAFGGDEQCNLSEAEVRSMLEMARSTGEPQVARRNYLILRLLYATGMRVSELVKTMFADVHFGENRIFVRQGKGEKDRYVLMDRQTGELLREWQGDKPLDAQLFSIRARQIQNVVSDIGARTGLLGKYQSQGYSLSPHSFRHAFATHLYKNGMESVAIEKLLGHADLATTFANYVDCDLPHWKAAYGRTHDLMRGH